MIIAPSSKSWRYSYSLKFESTNNVVKYEALVHGLLLLKGKKVMKVRIFGDSNLVINQIKGICQTKHPRMGSY